MVYRYVVKQGTCGIALLGVLEVLIEHVRCWRWMPFRSIQRVDFIYCRVIAGAWRCFFIHSDIITIPLSFLQRVFRIFWLQIYCFARSEIAGKSDLRGTAVEHQNDELQQTCSLLLNTLNCFVHFRNAFMIHSQCLFKFQKTGLHNVLSSRTSRIFQQQLAINSLSSFILSSRIFRLKKKKTAF